MKKIFSLGILLVLVFCMSACSFNPDITDLKKQMTDLETEISLLNDALIDLDAENRTLSDSITELESKNQSLTDSVAELENENQSLTDRLAKLEKLFKYDDKKIVSIFFCSIDYFGSFRDYEKYDFINRTYSTAYSEGASVISELEFTVITNFTKKDAENFFENIKIHGIYKLKESYEPEGVINDGGGWFLTITFSDGDTFESKGDNAYPSQRINLDNDFYALSGYKLFGY